jgi:hypothetical protein
MENWPSLSRDIKNWLVLGVIVLLTAGAGFAGGRWLAPTKVIEKTVETHAEKSYEAEFSQLQGQIRELTRQIQEVNQKKNVVATKTTTKAPDGTVTINERVEDKTETTSKTDTTTDRSAELLQELRLLKEKLVVDQKIVERTVERTSTPGWLFGVGVGANVPALLGGTTPPSLIPVNGILVGEVSVQRHLLLGIYAGLALNTRGDLQVRASKSF